MKLFIAVFLSIFFSCAVNAQGYFIVSGTVVNDATGMPMAAASVFAQNTTTGTITDNEGNFSLKLPSGGYDLIISFTGFRPESRRISSSDAAEKINVRLKLKEKELEEVAVISTNEVADGYTKYGRFFNDEFIGKIGDTLQCNIQNPEVLHFFFSKRRNRLKITATDPLIIKNNLLGYNIKYTLDSFVHEYNTQITVYTGYPLFEEMLGTPAQSAQWDSARRNAYTGSTLHFMRSLFYKALRPQHFEIQFIVKNNGKDDAIKIADPYGALNYKKDDSTMTVEINPNQQNVGILFSGAKPPAAYLTENPGEPASFEFSMLSFRPGNSIIIEQNGYFYDQDDLSVSGYWTWDKVAKQLPYDYHFLQE